MYRYFFIFLFLSQNAFSLLGDAEDSEHLKAEKIAFYETDQLKIIDSLIHLEEVKLEKHKELKTLILSLKEKEDAFLLDPDNKKKAYNLVSTARQALEIIAEMKIEHLFSPDFLKDLTFYASIAGKSKPSRPS